MEGIPSSEILKLIYALLPGFVAAWLFYGLTAHPRLSPFERTVQALIFTGIVQVIVLAFRKVMLLLGNVFSIGVWTDNVFFVVSILWAVIVGTCFSLFANKDWCHRWLRIASVSDGSVALLAAPHILPNGSAFSTKSRDTLCYT